jgi:hypothetical protein
MVAAKAVTSLYHRVWVLHRFASFCIVLYEPVKPYGCKKKD